MGTVSVVLAALVGWVATFLLERTLKPRPRLTGRPAGAYAVHFGIWLSFYGTMLTVTRRPVLAMSLALLAWLLPVLVSNAKFKSLREPLVFTDLPFLPEALRHPRLYVPFLGAWRGVLFVGAAAVVATGGWFLLQAWPVSDDWPGALPVAAALGLPAAALLWLGTRRAGTPTLDPVNDLQRWGLATSLWLYWRVERRRTLEAPASPFAIVRPSRPSSALPDMVVVQSESFFDARRLSGGVREDVLEHFDALRRVAVAEGRLHVPAWGANTVRTEFAFLSGVPSASLGVDRLNPYRALALQPLPTIVRCVRGLGYRTICVHPYASTFYGRDRVFPALGFDEFVDLRSFAGSRTFGPFVSDASVADKIISLVGRSDRPAFVFAITMENHGPLRLEAVSPGEAALYFDPSRDGGQPAPHDLTVYLRHLRNADRMVGTLRAWMEQRSRQGFLCFYGDHLPIMPDVYDLGSAQDGRTDYLIWDSQRLAGGRKLDIPVDRLGVLLLEAAGLLNAVPTQPAGVLRASEYSCS